MLNYSIALVIAALLEWLVGEPKRYHPLVLIGSVITQLERRFNHGSATRRFILGTICALSVIMLISYCVYSINYRLLHSTTPWLSGVWGGVILWFCVGYKSLIDHIEAIAEPLAQDDLPRARQMLARIVSRDTNNLSKTAIIKASCESAIENICDAIIAPLFWFTVFGPSACIAYRIINTFDAMWGYKTPRLINFGKFVARLDDCVNYLPARLTALAFYIQAPDKERVLSAWRNQAPLWESPNAGLVMSTGASALSIKLGGDAEYNGKVKNRPNAGIGDSPSEDNLFRCVKLVTATTKIGIATMLVVKLILA